jgi:hypothetical protein
MANDNLTFSDIEMAIAKVRIRRKFTRDPRGTRYEVIGPATDMRNIGIICGIKSTGRLLFITTYDGLVKSRLTGENRCPVFS